MSLEKSPPRKIEMIFYHVSPSPENKGLKMVLWKVTPATGPAIFDWGFAEWSGEKWEGVEVPAGYTCEVERWANTIDPLVLLKEPSRIIKI
jgi:hypothetical protein